MQPTELITALSEALGQRLKSAVLYGSALAEDFQPEISGYDVLLVIDPLGTAELQAMAPPFQSWTEAGNPTPELFTPKELERSADVFPIEWMDIQQARRVLYGADPFADVQVDMQHYRTQLERELKIKLLLLRRKYVSVVDESQHVGGLMLASVATFLVLLRAGLRLYNESPPVDKTQALDLLTQRLGVDLSPIRQVAEARTGQLPEEPEAIQALFQKYLSAIEQAVWAVDRHLHASTDPHST